MMSKLINIISTAIFILIFILLFLSSLKVMYINIKYFNIIKYGSIIDIESIEGALSDNERGVYINTIVIDQTKDTIKGGSQKYFSIGDKVKLRYVGKTGNRIFEVNDKTIRSRYGIWDWLSPFLFLLTLFMLYKFIKQIILKLKIKK